MNICEKNIPALAAASLAALTFILFGCGGEGGLRSVNGTVCSANFRPTQMTADKTKNEKEIPFSTDDNSIPAGDYTFDGSDFYYINKETNARIYIQDVKQKDGKIVNQVSCLRNFTPNMPSFSFAVEGISEMHIDGSGKDPILTVRDFSFDTGVEHIIHNSTVDAEKSNKPLPLEKVYGGDNKVTEVHFIRLNSQSYEIRSKGLSADGKGEYTLSVRLVYKK